MSGNEDKPPAWYYVAFAVPLVLASSVCIGPSAGLLFWLASGLFSNFTLTRLGHCIVSSIIGVGVLTSGYLLFAFVRSLFSQEIGPAMSSSSSLPGNLSPSQPPVEKRFVVGNLLPSVLSLYLVSVCFAAVYFEWQYAHRHDFWSSLFPGLFVSCGKAFIWPYFCFAGADEAKREEEWTEEELENLAHFGHSVRTQNKIDQAANRAEIIRMLKEALAESKLVRDEVLAKAHPDLPKMYREKWAVATAKMLQLLEADRRGGHGADEVDELFAEWEDWLLAHRKEVRIPARVTEFEK